MLKIVNQFWQFDKEEELNSFLDNCMADNSAEYHIERYGKSTKSGRFYAYGSVVPTIRFSKENAEAGKTDSVGQELNLG